MRPAVFFVAFVVMMVATFADAAALAARWVNPWLIYVPAAVIAAALLAHARVPPRLPENPAWYAVLALLAIAQAAAPFLAIPYLAAVKPALMVAVAAVLLNLRPRTGNLYQAEVMPGFTAFLALTALTWQSIAIVNDLAAVGVTHPQVQRIPAPMANVAAAAIVVVVFIMVSGIRRRKLQPCPAKAWLLPGIAVWLAAAAASHAPALREYAQYALLAAHLLLFVGATYLLTHLLPRREADELA